MRDFRLGFLNLTLVSHVTHEHINDVAKHVIDGASVVTVIGTLAGYLPAIAALFTIIWTAIRIYETPTVTRIRSRYRAWVARD
jgi:hypothetical protein